MKVTIKYLYLGMLICSVLGTIAFLMSVTQIYSRYSVQLKEKRCYQFLLSNLSSQEGGILRRLPLENREQAPVSLLSESVGLFMLYAAHIGDKATFDQQAKLVQNVFMASTGLLYWEVKLPSRKPENSSASLDDLRIAAALILGYEKWKERSYKELALTLSEGMLKHNIVNGDLFIQAYSWDKNGGYKDPVVDLSYLDLWAMKKLETVDPAWKPVIQKSEELLQKGLTPAGLFYDKYHSKYGENFFGDKNLINNLLCSLYLTQMGISDSGVYDFFKKVWETNQKIPGKFDPETAKPMADFENISVYAILMQVAVAKKDFEFAEKLYHKIVSYQVTDKASYFYGAFVLDEAHSFDNLQALLAFYEFRKKR